MFNWRRFLRKWSARGHWWLGLISAVPFVLLGLSGSMIVFRPQIEIASTPLSPHSCSLPAGPAEAIAAAGPLFPGRVIDRVYYVQPSSSLTYLVQASVPSQREVRISFDPCQNKVLGFVRTSWLDWLVDFHHNFLAGKPGRQLVGLSGIGLLLTALSGLLLRMQAGARWKQIFRIERKASARRFAMDTHRCIGILAIPLLLAQTLTGIGLAFPDMIRAIAGTSMESVRHSTTGKSHRKGRAKGNSIDLDRAVALARTTVPAGAIREIRLPSDKNDQISIRLWTPGDLRMSGDNLVVTDGSGARVLSVHTWRTSTLATKTSQAITLVHYGEWAGLTARCLSALLGLTPLTLFITGLVFKWGPRRRKMAVAAEREHVVDAVV